MSGDKLAEFARRAYGWRIACVRGKWCLKHADGSVVWISAEAAECYLDRGMPWVLP